MPLADDDAVKIGRRRGGDVVGGREGLEQQARAREGDAGLEEVLELGEEHVGDRRELVTAPYPLLDQVRPAADQHSERVGIPRRALEEATLEAEPLPLEEQTRNQAGVVRPAPV